jgi:hypothetical protein
VLGQRELLGQPRRHQRQCIGVSVIVSVLNVSSVLAQRLHEIAPRLVRTDSGEGGQTGVLCGLYGPYLLSGDHG